MIIIINNDNATNNNNWSYLIIKNKYNIINVNISNFFLASSKLLKKNSISFRQFKYNWINNIYMYKIKKIDIFIKMKISFIFTQ